MPDTPQYYMEDPTIWYSDSLYQIVVNFHKKDVSYHLTSEDGISNWKNRGVAFDKKSLSLYTLMVMWKDGIQSSALQFMLKMEK